MNEVSDPLQGTPYRTLRLLGEGGMGEVYEVQHLALGKIMVAKILRQSLAENRGLADRVRVEAQALAALEHPNVVDVVHFDWTRDGRPYFVMEKLTGRTLGAEFRARGPLPVAEAIEIVCQVLDGLGAAHEVGLVHRDIKLDNLFLHAPAGRQRIVKIIDFGIAKITAGALRGPAPPQLPTAEGAIVGTPRYVSPEQVLAKGVDGRADLYAVALVLYTLISGRGPFDHVKGVDLYEAHVGEEPDPPSKFAQQTIPAELDRVLLKSLRKDPAERFQTAAELARALERVAAALSSLVGWLPTTPAHAIAVASVPRGRPNVAADALPATRREPLIATDRTRPDAFIDADDSQPDESVRSGRVAAREPTEVLVQDKVGAQHGAELPGQVLSTRTSAPKLAPASSVARETTQAQPQPPAEGLLDRKPWLAYVVVGVAASSSGALILVLVGTSSLLRICLIVLGSLISAGAVALALSRR